ncbi:MAG TPA: neutral/alkaline non-lysosomal ceramidase N-terminal domain-containing protein [Myxococcaceae bacterium]|jgi:Neutral/alkaline non-lysosomal ceramidase, N-terminal|nr:neutral/alkaline non-lysosomal ceramidase N-terminal domain-containing protein [Myxococcaceae bacterium]
MRKDPGARRRRRWPWVLLGLGVVLSVVPFARLGREPRVRDVRRGEGTGPLRAGAFVSELSIPLPVEAVGYGLVRPEVDRVAFPVSARAVVLASDDERVGLVTLDLLLVDQGLVEAIRRRVSGLGLSTLWVAATHTHSSAGGFAWNPVAQVAATGRLRPSVRARVVEAASRALTTAASALEPVEAFVGVSELAGGTTSRDEFPEVDRRLTRVQLRGERGAVAQLVVLAAHPTLVPRPPPGLDADWPGRLARAQEGARQGVTLVLQGNVGNVTVQRDPGGAAPPPEGFAGRIEAALSGIPLHPAGVGLWHARLEVALPGPDASRFVPRGLGTLVSNVALWPWAPGWAELGELRIGSVRLLGLPVETTAASGAVLEKAAGGARAVALVNGYLGYVEPADRVERGAGESRRQVFGQGLLESLRFGTEATRAAVRPGPEASSTR